MDSLRSPLAETDLDRAGSVLSAFPQHAAQIGLVVANWTAVELILTDWLGRLLGTDETKALMLWRESSAMAPRIKLMRRLARRFLKDCPARSRLIELLGDAQELSHLRHRYAHALYRANDTRTILYLEQGTAPSNDKTTLHEAGVVTLADLVRDVRQLITLGLRMEALDFDSIPVVP